MYLCVRPFNITAGNLELNQRIDLISTTAYENIIIYYIINIFTAVNSSSLFGSFILHVFRGGCAAESSRQHLCNIHVVYVQVFIDLSVMLQVHCGVLLRRPCLLNWQDKHLLKEEIKANLIPCRHPTCLECGCGRALAGLNQ